MKKRKALGLGLVLLTSLCGLTACDSPTHGCYAHIQMENKIAHVEIKSYTSNYGYVCMTLEDETNLSVSWTNIVIFNGDNCPICNRKIWTILPHN